MRLEAEEFSELVERSQVPGSPLLKPKHGYGPQAFRDVVGSECPYPEISTSIERIGEETYQQHLRPIPSVF